MKTTLKELLNTPQETNLVGYWVNLSRVYEIALLGNYSIEVLFSPDYIQGFDDYARIKEFYNDVEFSANGNLRVEIEKPDYSYDTSKCESLQDIRKRVKEAKEFKVENTSIPNPTNSLLNTLSDRKHIPLNDRENILDISKTIAQLSLSDSIRIEHVAEAAQYQINYYEPVCSGENSYILFGMGIKVALHDIDSMDIESAIDYLKTKLK